MSGEKGSAKHESLLGKILHYFNLDGETDDFDKIHETIEKDINFRGTNLWILIFAIIVASVGLNMNSTAVVIGAMLISPLMGPINGMGYSIATYNFPLFRKAAKNYSFAVLSSLAASTLYFAISPVSTAHSELLARTSPTIYDVLIALFGGLAGIVAISSKLKGNVIPGVAIATALMPPLCTAGYGLATGQFNFFFGALYLFTINTVFIAISSIAVSQILKFPIRTLVDHAEKLRVNRWITIIILVTLLPSIYFGYGLVQKEQFVENATRFVDNVSVYEGNFLLKNEINREKRHIHLIYGGNALTDAQKESIRTKAIDFKLEGNKIEISQGLSFDAIRRRYNEEEIMTAEIQRLSSLLRESEAYQDSVARRSLIGRQLLAEMQPLFPGIVSCAYSDAEIFVVGNPKPVKMFVVVIGVDDGMPKENERTKIRDWLRARLETDNLKIYYEQ